MIIRCWACLLPLLVLGCSTQILAGSRRCSTYILFVRLASHLASACTIQVLGLSPAAAGARLQHTDPGGEQTLQYLYTFRETGVPPRQRLHDLSRFFFSRIHSQVNLL
jgi:hypothetical protein